MKVTWGIISTALINRRFIAGAREAPNVELLAVASREQALAERYAAEHGLPRAYGSYEALLADPEIEAVYISLPNSLHVDWSIRALEAGKHVLCEKPLGRRAADVERAFDVAQAAGLFLMEAFMYRHNPQTRRLAELVAGGAIGRPRMIRASFSHHGAGPGNVRLSAALEGGALMDVGCYCVSGARLLAGEPVRVSGEQVIGGEGVDVTFAGTLRFADDVVAHFDAGVALADRSEFEVSGEDASLYLADPWHCRRPAIELRTDRGTERIELDRADSYGLQADNLSLAIRGTAAPLLGRADAVGQARAIEALYEAANGGTVVAL